MKRAINFMVCLVLSVSLLMSWGTCIRASAEGDFEADLETFLKHKPSKEEIETWSVVITTLKEDGISDEGAAGICGNILAEGGCEFAIENYCGRKTKEGKTYNDFKVGESYDYGDWTSDYYTTGEGHGLVQWSFGRVDNLLAFADKNKCEFVTVRHWRQKKGKFETCKIPSLPGQVAFILEELHNSYSKTYSKIKNSKDAAQAAYDFCWEYEIPASDVGRQDNAKRAVACVKSCDGVVGDSGKKKAKETADIALTAGIWDESKFVNFCKVIDVPATFPELYDLKADERIEIRDWNNTLKASEESKPFKLLRAVVIFVGIIITVYSTFLYIAFQFDRNQNFVEIKILDCLTLGHLTVSASDDESSFSATAKGKKAVTHKDICIVCVIGIALGVLILSGKMFALIAEVIGLIKKGFGD